jgi:hypothetical protein
LNKGGLNVFLSYAREDQARVDRLYRHLDGAGFCPWMDRTNLVVSQEWLKEIHTALRKADVFVACVSENSVTKGGVLQEEIDTALRLWKRRWWRRLRIVPVRLDSTPAPPALQRFQWFELQDDSEWTDLAKAIRNVTRRGRAIAFAAAAAAILLAASVGWALYPRDPHWPAGPQNLGVTLFRLRDARPGDQVRIPTVDAGGVASELTPETVPLNTAFRRGDKVRLRVKVEQEGYLYVVNRELGNAAGDARLIFPDSRIPVGNLLPANSIVDLPTGKEPFWVLASDSTDYSGEEITVLLTPRQQPEDDVPSGDNVILPRRVLENWQRWGQPVRLAPGPRESGRTDTYEEFQRGARALQLGSSPPAAKFGMNATAENTPILATFKLAVGR